MILMLNTFSMYSDFCKIHLFARRAAILSCMDGSEEEGVDSEGGEVDSGEDVFER